MRDEYYLDQAPGAVLHPWLEMSTELLQIVSHKFIATLKTHFMNANALLASKGAQAVKVFVRPSVCLVYLELSIFIFMALRH